MPFDSYQSLQDSILNWLGRPGDALLLPAIPDFITIFETEARDRLQNRFAEQTNVSLGGSGGTFYLPMDFGALRRIVYDNNVLEFVPPFAIDQMPRGAGKPSNYTIEGLTLRLGPPPDTSLPVIIDYVAGLPALSTAATTNWLLQQYPDLYLYGSLVAAEAYIGNDERVAGWVQAREAAFERIRQASLRGLAGAAPLRVRPAGATP